MSDISELERRITDALDRISKGIEARPAVVSDDAGGEDLLEELEVERATNERLIAAKEKHSGQMERLETRVQRLSDKLAEREADNARLAAMIDTLRENNAALRAANSDHQDASNTSLEALETELADLRAARAADLAEIDDVLAEMQPLLKEA